MTTEQESYNAKPVTYSRHRATRVNKPCQGRQCLLEPVA